MTALRCSIDAVVETKVGAASPCFIQEANVMEV